MIETKGWMVLDFSKRLELDDKLYEHVTRIFRIQRNYQRTSATNLRMNLFLQIIILTCTAILPILLTIPQVNRLIPTIVSIILALATAYAVFLKPGERARNLRIA